MTYKHILARLPEPAPPAGLAAKDRSCPSGSAVAFLVGKHLLGGDKLFGEGSQGRDLSLVEIRLVE